MNEKEKAKELVEKFKSFVHCTSSWNEYDDYLELENSKQCAKIAVEEIIMSGGLEPQLKRHKMQNIPAQTHEIEYWFEVKKEIDLL